jgi:hypothetical protein
MYVQEDRQKSQKMYVYHELKWLDQPILKFHKNILRSEQPCLSINGRYDIALIYLLIGTVSFNLYIDTYRHTDIRSRFY